MNLDESLITEVNEKKLTDIEVFTKIWTSPRQVFKYLNDSKYDKFMYALLIFAGITRAFDRAATKNMGDNMPLMAVIAICIVLGGLIGWITYYIYAALLSWTGKWLKAEGNLDSLLRMISYAMLPSIASLILLIPQIAIFGNTIFQSEVYVYESGSLNTIIFYFTFFLEIFLSIWSISIMVIGISEVQKLSIGKSILNMILPAVVIIVPIVSIAIIAFITGDLFG